MSRQRHWIEAAHVPEDVRIRVRARDELEGGMVPLTAGEGRDLLCVERDPELL
jgi:hypothetical protein